MPLGTFTLVINGEQIGERPETTATLRIRVQGRDSILDRDADLIYFPHLSAVKGVSIGLPYTVLLPTDVASGSTAQSTEIGYEVSVTTRNGGSIRSSFAARAADSTVNLVDLLESIVIPVADSIRYRDEAEAARDEAVAAANAAEAVGTTNDTVIAGRINDPASATRTALSATYARKRSGVVVSAAATDGSDQTAVVQAEIDALTAFGGGTLELPAGDVILDGVVMKHRVSVRGASAFGTRIQAKANSTKKAVFLLDSGPVQEASLSDLRIMPNGNTGQGAIFFKARDTNGGFTSSCGWWNSELRNLQIGDFSGKFSGHAIWLSGGGNTFLAPIQWITITDVHVNHGATGCPLLMSGQVGQVVIVNGGFYGPSNTTAVQTGATKAGVDIYCAQQLDDNGNNLALTGPYGVVINGTSIQSNGQGFRAEIGGPYTLVGPHFEDAAQCVYVDNSYLSWVGGRASGATNTGLTGYVARTGSTGRITVTGVRSYGTVDRHFEGGHVRARDCMLGNAPITANRTTQVAPDASGVMNLTDYKTAIVSTSANVLRTLNSEHLTDEVVYLKAHGGSIQIGSGGNISMGGKADPYTLPNGAVATLVRFDLSGTWFLAGTSA